MKTEQQKRFEAAMEAAGHRVSEQYPNGLYVWPFFAAMWEVWQLAESSGLALAAALKNNDASLLAPVGNSAWGEAYQDGFGDGVARYEEAIRALMAER